MNDARLNSSKTRLRETWLLGKREATQLLIVYAVFTATWFTVGWLLKNQLAVSPIVQFDQTVAEWFEQRRTPTLNSLTYVGSMMSDTVVKIVVTALVALAMLIAWKRWLEPLIVGAPLALEALCFITITTLVRRPRPDVARLEGSPIDSTYPSGHVAAAVAYSAIIVVVFWHTRRRWIRVIAIAAGAIIPACVGISRLYRGMHFLTDVVFGALLGAASVIATTRVLTRAAERRGEHAATVEGEHIHSKPPELVAP